jgi:CubicO group peptidase (beta-lactamase class C family)
VVHVDHLLDDAVVRGVFPSAQLVVGDGGQVVHEHVVRATVDTKYDVASLTKALCTAQLAQRLEDLDGPTPIAGVTVRHLLTHSSGLPAWLPLYERHHDRAAIVAAAVATPLERAPGAAAVYSDLGFIVLGHVIEEALGARLDALFAEHVAGPSGSGARFAPDGIDGPVAPTEGVRGVVHDENCRAAGGILGHAGLFATARDVSALAAAVVAAWTAGDPRVRAMLAPRPGSTWRLGWDGPAATGSAAGELWPKDGAGHLGFTGCSIWLDPGRGRWVVLLTNRVHPTRANNEIKAFRPALHDAIVRGLIR